MQRSPVCVRRYRFSYRHLLRSVRGAFKGCCALSERMGAWQAPYFVCRWFNHHGPLSTNVIYALAWSTSRPRSTTVDVRLFRCAVRCAAGGGERVGASRVAIARIMHTDPRGSADLVLDVRLAGTGPSAHRVDGGPIGQRALLPM